MMMVHVVSVDYGGEPVMFGFAAQSDATQFVDALTDRFNRSGQGIEVREYELDLVVDEAGLMAAIKEATTPDEEIEKLQREALK